MQDSAPKCMRRVPCDQTAAAESCELFIDMERNESWSAWENCWSAGVPKPPLQLPTKMRDRAMLCNDVLTKFTRNRRLSKSDALLSQYEAQCSRAFAFCAATG